MLTDEEERLYKYLNKIDWIADEIGSDVEENVKRTKIVDHDYSKPLPIDNQFYLLNSDGEIVNTVSEDVLSSIAEDELRIELIKDSIGLLKTGDQPFRFNLENDNVGLFTPSDFSETRDITKWGGTSLTGADVTTNLTNIDISLSNYIDIALSTLRDAVKIYDSEFLIDQDVNSSAYSSSETEITRCRFIQYSLSGAGAFDLVINFTDGAGTTIFSKTINSADGSEISGEIKVYSKNVIIEVNDQSGSSNPVVGGVYAK